MRNFIDDIDDHLRSARTGGYHDGKYNRGYDDGLDMAIAFLDMLTVRCKDCKHWKDSDGVYRRGLGAESKCPINLQSVYDGTFYCGMAERREDES